MDLIRVMGFDFGLRHIGVAVGDGVSGTAQLLPSLSAKGGTPNWDEIRTHIQHWKPNQLLVGIPLNMDGSTQPMTGHAKGFLRALEKRFDLPVSGVDERLTTVEAKSQLFEEYGSKGLQKDLIDSFSAKLIIEQWLREH